MIIPKKAEKVGDYIIAEEIEQSGLYNDYLATTEIGGDKFRLRFYKSPSGISQQEMLEQFIAYSNKLKASVEGVSRISQWTDEFHHKDKTLVRAFPYSEKGKTLYADDGSCRLEKKHAVSWLRSFLRVYHELGQRGVALGGVYDAYICGEEGNRCQIGGLEFGVLDDTFSDWSPEGYVTIPPFAPEVERGSVPTPESDVFSVGALVKKVISDTRLTDLPDEFCAALEKTQSKCSLERPSAGDLLKALDGKAPEKPNFVLYYWQYDEAYQACQAGSVCPLTHSDSAFFNGVEQGDWLYLITINGGRLYLFNRIVLQDVLDEEGARKIDENLPGGKKNYLLNRSREQSTLLDITEIADQIEFDNGQKIKIEDGRVTINNFPGPRRITEQSARFLEDYRFNTPSKKKNADIVLLLDISGGNQAMIDFWRDHLQGFINDLQKGLENTPGLSADSRIRLCGYRDYEMDGEYWWEETPFCAFSDIDEVVSKLKQTQAKGGCDEPECLLDALWKITSWGNTEKSSAANPLQWSDPTEAKRIVVFFTDATFKPNCLTPEAAGANVSDIISRIHDNRIMLNGFVPEGQECYYLLFEADQSECEYYIFNDSEYWESLIEHLRKNIIRACKYASDAY